jgi:hypothetical protein
VEAALAPAGMMPGHPDLRALLMGKFYYLKRLHSWERRNLNNSDLEFKTST